MKFSIKLTLYVGLLIIYFYLFGSKSLDKFKDGGDKEDSLLFQLRDRPPAGLLQHSLDFNDAWSLLHKKLLRLFCWLQTGHISLALLP